MHDRSDWFMSIHGVRLSATGRFMNNKKKNAACSFALMYARDTAKRNTGVRVHNR